MPTTLSSVPLFVVSSLALLGRPVHRPTRPATASSLATHRARSPPVREAAEQISAHTKTPRPQDGGKAGHRPLRTLIPTHARSRDGRWQALVAGSLASQRPVPSLHSCGTAPVSHRTSPARRPSPNRCGDGRHHRVHIHLPGRLPDGHERCQTTADAPPGTTLRSERARCACLPRAFTAISRLLHDFDPVRILVKMPLARYSMAMMPGVRTPP